jgi:hypothetical protein
MQVNFLRGATVASKLKIIIMATTCAALLVACGAAAFYDIVSLRNSIASNLKILAELIASNSAITLTFTDDDRAAEILRSLKAQPNVTRAAIFTKEGKVFARYLRD